jgi:hypothetical protein
VAGNAGTDTVRSVLLQALIVEVRDGSGVPVPGAVVRFAGAPSADPYALEAYLMRLDQQNPVQMAVDTTDAHGQAAMIVQLGTRAGPQRVVVTVPVYGYVDTARFTGNAGSAYRIGTMIRDTALIVGSSYPLGAAVVDRFGNPRPGDPLTYAVLSPTVSVDGTGAVKGVAVGRGTIAVTSGTATDTARVTIVPDGVLAVVASTGSGTSIATVKLDGSQLKPLTTVTSSVMLPRWSPSGDRIVFYERDPNSNAGLSTVDLRGVRSALVPSPAGPTTQFQPRFSADGQWIHFTGLSSGSYYLWSLWRMHVDGTGTEQLASSPSMSYSQPSPSPDGTRVVFNAGGVISTVDLATKTVTSLGVTGSVPLYSPDGSRIVFLSGSYSSELSVMNADGSNRRTLSGRLYDTYSSPTWSPDGKWIVLRGSSSLELINVATFEVLPIPSSRSFYQPAFKP